MKLYINEKIMSFEKKSYRSYEIKEMIKKDADIIIVNGFPEKDDVELKDGDNIVFIKKGEIPDAEELEAVMMARHTPGVHKKIRDAVVGIAGLGGLGSNVAIHLARIGVGKLVLVDFDLVVPSNLNRQQYYVRHIGMKKTEAIKEILQEINPFVEIETKDIYLTEDNITEIFNNVGIIVEAFDNPLCKAYLINKVMHDMPDKYVVAASGIAGFFSNNIIKTRKIGEKLYLIGDNKSEAKQNSGLMAPRAALAASHQSNTVLRIILGEYGV